MADEEDIVWIREEPSTEPEPSANVPENGNVLEPTPEPPREPLKPLISGNDTRPEVVVTSPPNEEEIHWIKEEPQKPKEDDVSIASSFDISECERKLNQATEETKELVEQLKENSDKLEKNNAVIAKQLADGRRDLASSTPKTIEDEEQLPPPPELPSGGLPSNVESILIGVGLIQNATGVLVLPSGVALVTEETQGILLFDFQGNLLNRISNPEWRNPRSPIYHKEHVLILIDIRDSEGNFQRSIVKFTVDMQLIARIEGPKWIRDATVYGERLSIAHTDFLYLAIRGEIFSAIYELTPVGQWTELEYKLSENYVDMLAFATIGPITQLLVVEGRMNYVLQLSVRESEIVGRRRLAVCERPGALAKDEAGRLFVANRASASIQLVDTRNWVSCRPVAISDAVVPHFSASWGLLALPLKNAVRLQKYSFRR